MNYFASPTNSDRARRFRLAFGNATPGQDFMFEGQPYAGPQPQPQPQVQPQVAPPPNANARTHFSNYPDPTSGTTPITHEGPANAYDINQASPEQMRAMQEQIGGPGFNSPPRFASANNESSRWMVDAPMGFNGGQPPGLLDKQFSRTMGAGSRQGGLLTQPPNANGSNSAQTGYDKNAGWAAAGKIMSDFGLEYMREDPFGDRGR